MVGRVTVFRIFDARVVCFLRSNTFASFLHFVDLISNGRNFVIQCQNKITKIVLTWPLRGGGG